MIFRAILATAGDSAQLQKDIASTGISVVILAIAAVSEVLCNYRKLITIARFMNSGTFGQPGRKSAGVEARFNATKPP